MPKVDSKRFVDFYNFWRWEYTRRNARYRELVDAVFNGNIPAGLEMEKAYSAWGKQVECGPFTLRVYSKRHLSLAKITDAPSFYTCEILAEFHQDEEKSSFVCFQMLDEDEHFDVIGTFLYTSSSEILISAVNNKLKHNHPILSDDLMRFSSEKLVYYLHFKSIRWLEWEFYHIVPRT